MKIFSAEIEASAADAGGFPEPDLPEIAFLGRSNVGKSSLLNRLVGRRKLAYTSGTPGKTRLAHFFAIQVETERLRLVDLPGYGFARVSHAERKRWRALVESYLDGRPNLRAAVLLQDVRRDLSDDETDLIAWLEQRAVTPLVAFTKTDKLKRMRLAKRLRELAAQLPTPAPPWVATSAQTGAGMDELWKYLVPPAADG